MSHEHGICLLSCSGPFEIIVVAGIRALAVVGPVHAARAFSSSPMRQMMTRTMAMEKSIRSASIDGELGPLGVSNGGLECPIVENS